MSSWRHEPVNVSEEVRRDTPRAESQKVVMDASDESLRDTPSSADPSSPVEPG